MKPRKDAQIEYLKQLVTALANALSASDSFIHEHCCDAPQGHPELLEQAKDAVLERS